MSYFAVIGAGSWGTTLANHLALKGHDVSLWAHEKEVVDEINAKCLNNVYLPGVNLSDNIRATDSLEHALKNSRFVLNVVPSQFARAVFNKATEFLPEEAVVISASKGIEHGTLLTLSNVLKDITGRQVAALSGPSFAEEVSKKLPTAVTVAADNRDTCYLLQDIFNTEYFRVYTSRDIIGVELGGALKNVMAIASGISDGLGLGSSARAALITRGLAEMTRLGIVMGAEDKTFSGLSGLGDLVLTCTGKLSRNYSVGFRLGKGERLSDILSNTKTVAEGVATSKSAFELARKHNVEMPIVEQIYMVINDGKNPGEAVKHLMNRALKSEF
jgi:glycerol-3-phosphate dehydrogenase (NAD(P)+)